MELGLCAKPLSLLLFAQAMSMAGNVSQISLLPLAGEEEF